MGYTEHDKKPQASTELEGRGKQSARQTTEVAVEIVGLQCREIARALKL